jgi:hypothetical protein
VAIKISKQVLERQGEAGQNDTPAHPPPFTSPSGLKLKQELKALGFSLPQKNLDAEGALALAEQIPPPYRESLPGQRLMQLLKGYGRGEEVAPLLNRLARQDRVALQQRYALLSFIRTVLPLLGLIGTVLGFNQQMPHFVELGQAAQDLEALRHQLQQFAGGLSMAFDTTLLALAYMLILWPWIFFLVRREEELLGTIDGIVQETAGRLQKVSSLSQELHQVLQGANNRFFKHLERTLEAATAHSLKAFHRGIQQGIDGAVREWIEHWLTGLSRTSHEILEALSHQDRKVGEEIRKALEGNAGLMVEKLDAMEKALVRPRPSGWGR